MALPDNLWLPALLSALATLHAYLALDVIGRVTRTRGAVPALWLGFGAAVLAVGVWATRQLGLAASSGLDGLRGAAAFGTTWLATVAAFWLMERPRRPALATALAGSALGGGLAFASRLDLSLDGGAIIPDLASMLLCAIVGAWLALALRGQVPTRRRAWLSAAVLGLTVVAVPCVGVAMARDGAAARLLGRNVATAPAAAAFVISALVLLLAAVVRRAQRELARQAAQIRGELEAARQALVHQAFHDVLTALPNRAKVLAQLQELLPHAHRDAFEVAVMFIDLDGFKSINDTLGHEAGDAFLRCVADALRDSVRPRDTVARFGGDEFVVVLERYRSRGNLSAICNKILARVSAPVLVAGQKVTATPSIGVAVFPGDGNDPAELLRHADIAMYAAKQRGKAGFCFYEPRMIEQASERLALSTELREGLGRGEIRVCYQPKVDLRTRELVGLEALARWAHPTRGALPPSVFIPLAEDCGLIARLGETVVREVTGQIAQWRAQGLPLVPVAINLSMQEVQGAQFVPALLRTLGEAGLDRDAIEFEITESAAMTDVHTTLGQLRTLDTLGFRIAIDDFGTGFSSLSHLRQLPARAIKIDQSFVHGARRSHHDREIAEAIIALARKLRLHTIAEGVETEEQARWLQRAGCDTGQGFLFGRPLDADRVAAMLRERCAAPTLDG
jgi:diguanylate cyclase (GGDEF)-like protein